MQQLAVTMITEPHIVWKDLEPSDALERLIYANLEELSELYPNIVAARVAIERPHRHHRHGAHFVVKIELSVPGRMLTATRDPDLHKNYEDAYASVNEAFGTIRRQLEDYVRVRRGFVKERSVGALEGTVQRLLPEMDCGFIDADDGTTVYFHAHSVLDDAWEDLDVGDRVRFHLEYGTKGPQASSVHVIDVRHRQPEDREPGLYTD
jgi:cold shock CspA family protein/ribosome-associated translation inhibitor RaiA